MISPIRVVSEEYGAVRLMNGKEKSKYSEKELARGFCGNLHTNKLNRMPISDWLVKRYPVILNEQSLKASLNMQGHSLHSCA